MGQVIHHKFAVVDFDSMLGATQIQPLVLASKQNFEKPAGQL
jgi:hypothetical protein